MALTATEKTQIIFYLGHSAKTIVVGSTHFNGIVNKRFENLDADIEKEIRLLTRGIKNVREKLIDSQDIMKAKKVGDITINNDENKLLRKDLRRLCKELGRILDIACLGGGGLGSTVRVCL